MSPSITTLPGKVDKPLSRQSVYRRSWLQSTGLAG